MTERRLLAIFLLLGLGPGCHFHAGFGKPARGKSLVERDRDQNTVVNSDGSSTTTETVVETVGFDDGSSTTVSTTTHTSKDQNGNQTSRSSSTTTTEKSSSGTMTSSTSSTQ